MSETDSSETNAGGKTEDRTQTKITLRRPIEGLDGQRIEGFIIRELSADDIADFIDEFHDAKKGQQMLGMIAASSDLTLAEVRRLSAADLMEAVQAAETFLGEAAGLLAGGA